MIKHAKYAILTLVLCLTLTTWLSAQTSYTVPYSGSNSITTCYGKLYDNGGANGNYSTYCSGYTIIYPSTPGAQVSISGTLSFSYDTYLYIYDGAGTYGTLLWSWYGYGSTTVPLLSSSSGSLTVSFTSYSYTSTGFELTVSCCNACGCAGPQNVTAVSGGNNDITVSWDPVNGGAQYIVEYGVSGFTPGNGTLFTTSNTTETFSNLLPGQTYDFYVYIDCDKDGTTQNDLFSLVSSCVSTVSNCIDFTDLYAAGVKCTYGSFSNPYQSTGVQNGRHTVMSSGYDSYTGNKLPCVPPCENASVRLGNSSTGSQAESVTYTYVVDTAQYNILLLKYAAVLQNPGHSASQQPRFTFKILNQYGAEIDPICGSADFISNASLGWNYGTSSTILWKDWTTVGIDLTPYHGQTIAIQLTTYDCNQSGHFGYAYYTLSCAQKRITVETCGTVAENTYTAPDGFNYKWYFANDPTTIISTQQSCTVPITANNQTLYCEASFIDKSSCRFTLSTDVHQRYPLADFSFTNKLCTYQYDFTEMSSISSDGITPDGSGNHCDQFEWDFGDGGTSTEANPSHTYPGPGTYNVKMVSIIGGGACRDSLIKKIVIPPFGPQIIGDTVICDGENVLLNTTEGVTFAWSTGDSTAAIVVTPHTTTTYTLFAADSNGCADTLTHTITVYPTYFTPLTASVCQGESFYEYGYQLTNLQQVGTTNYVLNLTTVNGCDSILSLDMTVREMPKVELGNDKTVCFEEIGGIYLDAGKNYEHYLWNTGENSRVIHVTDTGYYAVEVNNQGCIQTDDIHIYELCPYQLYLPNTISPYYPDGVNDYFSLPSTERILTMEITIFDRWGKIVFESNDPNFKWDGSVGGVIVPNQVYNYRLLIVSDDTKRHVYKGHITVL
ncbi:MAG: gliding motility-associated C-terminal domain-containing protein [Bacteroidales bacterium]|nr:gliding motility-associated C-terminal domain-containing protein [Bacteroidales bacterium]